MLRSVIAESPYDRYKTYCPDGPPLCHSCGMNIVEEEDDHCAGCLKCEMEDEEDEDEL